MSKHIKKIFLSMIFLMPVLGNAGVFDYESVWECNSVKPNWYCDETKKTQADVEKVNNAIFKPSQPQTTMPIPYATPVNQKPLESKSEANKDIKSDTKRVTDLSQVQSIEQLRQLLKDKEDIAVMNPTEDNIKNYLEVWKASQEKASVFADTWQRVVWKNPQLDYSINHPTSAMGLNVVNRGKLEAKNTNMRALAKQHGIIFFFRSDCPYCHAVSKVLKTMENEFGMEVIAASLDGGGLPEYPVYKDGRNLAGKWEVQVVPALFLANKQTTEYAPIGFGAMALDEIVDRIYSLTNVPVGTGF